MSIRHNIVIQYNNKNNFKILGKKILIDSFPTHTCWSQNVKL